MTKMSSRRQAMKNALLPITEARWSGAILA